MLWKAAADAKNMYCLHEKKKKVTRFGSFESVLSITYLRSKWYKCRFGDGWVIEKLIFLKQCYLKIICKENFDHSALKKKLPTTSVDKATSIKSECQKLINISLILFNLTESTTCFAHNTKDDNEVFKQLSKNADNEHSHRRNRVDRKRIYRSMINLVSNDSLINCAESTAF